MRSIALFFAILSIFSVSSAQENSSSSNFGKESYLPAEGDLAAAGGFTIINNKTSIKGPAGTVSDAKNSKSGFTYRVGYGLSNYLTLGLQGRYIFSDNSDYTYGPGSTQNGTSSTNKSSGIEEPELAAILRIRNDESSKLRIDISAGVSPKLQKAKFATSSANGNEGIGGTKFRLGVNIYKEIKSLEFAFNLNRNFYSLQQFEDPSDPTKTTEHGEHQSTEIIAAIFKEVSEDFSLGGSLEFNIADSYQIDYLTNTSITTSLQYDSATSTGLSILGKYKLEENSLLQFGVGSILNYSQTASVGTTKLNISDVSATVFQLSWLQKF